MQHPIAIHRTSIHHHTSSNNSQGLSCIGHKAWRICLPCGGWNDALFSHMDVASIGVFLAHVLCHSFCRFSGYAESTRVCLNMHWDMIQLVLWSKRKKPTNHLTQHCLLVCLCVAGLGFGPNRVCVAGLGFGPNHVCFGPSCLSSLLCRPKGWLKDDCRMIEGRLKDD